MCRSHPIQRLIIGLAGLLLLAACTGQNMAVPETAETVPTWPPAPLEAKITWVKEYQILEDTASRRGLWGKVTDFFLGPIIANMTRPYGVCTDNNQRLFVADTGGSLIHVFDMHQEKYFAIEGENEFRLRSPIGVTYVAGFLYITDSARGQILRYDFEKGILRPWSTYQQGRPTGIGYAENSGLFYVSDTAAHEVIVFNQAGTEKFRFGGRGTAGGEFNFPTDIWIDAVGQVYVTDALNARIQIFTDSGEFISNFGHPGDTPGSFAKPKGLAVDLAGHIYVCDALFDAVQVFDAKGQLLISFGDNGTRPGQFWMPSGIFIDQQNQIFVADTYNRRIQVFKYLD